MTRRAPLSVCLDLFEDIPKPASPTLGSFDFRVPVKQLVGQVLKASPESRHMIAARISDLVGQETTRATLDSYTSPGVERLAWNLPLWKAPVLEMVCDSRALAEWHAGVLGGRILWGREVIDADIGKRERLIRELQDEVRNLKSVSRVVR